MTGLDPGRFGFYGFRNRDGYDREEYTIASSADVRQNRIWDILSNAGHRVILVGVPQTYPVCPLNGRVVTDFLTPSTQADAGGAGHRRTPMQDIHQEVCLGKGAELGDLQHGD